MMKSFSGKALLLLGCALLAVAANYWLNPAVAAFKNMPDNQLTVEQAQAYGERALWLDARSDSAYSAGHVPGALPLTIEAFDEQLIAVLDLWTPQTVMIVYCDSESCNASAEVAARLTQYMGESVQGAVFTLKGGWQAWQQANQ